MNSIFEGFLATPESLDAFGERNFIAAMLRFEAALARAQAGVGLIPEAAAQSIIGTCKAELFDAAKIVRESAQAGSVCVPLVAALKDTVGLFNPDAVAFVHFGSTSQDAIDTAMVLVTRDVLTLIDADVQSLVGVLLDLAGQHARTPILARTLMQPASVTSFGLKCADWAAALVRSRQRTLVAARRALCLQLGGAVGTLAQMQGRGSEVAQLMATDLGIGRPLTPWHTQRDEWVALGCELGLLVGSLGKIARDIALMSQFEVGEVAEPPDAVRRSSSAMPDKRNPVACMVALAAAQRAPHRVAALLAAMPQELERGLGNWQAELAEWPGLVMSTHGSARALAQALPGLQVKPERMRANLEAARLQARSQSARAGGVDWFAPALVDSAAELAISQTRALREMDRPSVA